MTAMQGVEPGKPPSPPADVRPAPRGLSEWGSPILGLAYGGFLAVLVIANIESEDPVAQQLTFAVQCLAPGALALFATWQRPSLYLVSGVVGTITAFISMAGVALPLLVPTGMSFVAFGRRSADSRPRLAAPVLAALGLFLVMASWASLVFHQDPYCYTGPNFSDCGSDRITTIEADVSLALSLAGIILPVVLAAPKNEGAAA